MEQRRAINKSVPIDSHEIWQRLWLIANETMNASLADLLRIRPDCVLIIISAGNNILSCDELVCGHYEK